MKQVKRLVSLLRDDQKSSTELVYVYLTGYSAFSL